MLRPLVVCSFAVVGCVLYTFAPVSPGGGDGGGDNHKMMVPDAGADWASLPDDAAAVAAAAAALTAHEDAAEVARLRKQVAELQKSLVQQQAKPAGVVSGGGGGGGGADQLAKVQQQLLQTVSEHGATQDLLKAAQKQLKDEHTVKLLRQQANAKSAAVAPRAPGGGGATGGAAPHAFHAGISEWINDQVSHTLTVSCPPPNRHCGRRRCYPNPNPNPDPHQASPAEVSLLYRVKNSLQRNGLAATQTTLDKTAAKKGESQIIECGREGGACSLLPKCQADGKVTVIYGKTTTEQNSIKVRASSPPLSLLARSAQ
jgi:hypothetical protein